MLSRWYRNPLRSAVASFGVTYGNAQGTGGRCARISSFPTRAAPRSSRRSSTRMEHLENSLGKLKALALSAAEPRAEWHRIEALAKIDNQMRVLDLQQ